MRWWRDLDLSNFAPSRHALPLASSRASISHPTTLSNPKIKTDRDEDQWWSPQIVMSD